jgi:cytochrome c
MKKLIVIVAIALGLFVASCGNQNGSDNPSGTSNANTTDGVVNDSNQVGNQTGNAPMANDSFANSIPKGNMSSTDNVTRGSALIAARDCKTCHEIQKKNIGPSYQMIADKYGNNDAMADELSLKIIKGGSGRWGQVVMPPHNDISTEDARDMARYILSLSTNK